MHVEYASCPLSFSLYVLSHLYQLNILLICLMSIVTYAYHPCHTLYAFTTDVLSFVLSYQCCIYVLFAYSMSFICLSPIAYTSPTSCSLLVYIHHATCPFSSLHVTFVSVPCSTYTELKYTIPTRTTYMHICCLSVTHHAPCNLLLCGHCCYVIQIASWDKCFATPFM